MDIRPSSEFSYDGGKSKLANLSIGAADGPQLNLVVPGDVHTNDALTGADTRDGSGTHSRLLRLSAWIDIDSHISVCTNIQFARYALTQYRSDALGH